MGSLVRGRGGLAGDRGLRLRRRALPGDTAPRQRPAGRAPGTRQREPRRVSAPRGAHPHAAAPTHVGDGI